MRQEPEIFTTTSFFFFFLKRTIRITTNMVGPHNLFFVFHHFEDLFKCFFFPQVTILLRLRGLSDGFDLWSFRSSRFAAVCKHKNTTRVASVRQSFRLFRAPPVLSPALTTSPPSASELQLNVPRRLRVEGDVFSHGVVGVADVGVFCRRHWGEKNKQWFGKMATPLNFSQV